MTEEDVHGKNLTLAEVAKLLECSRKHAWWLVAVGGTLPGVREGRKWVVRPQDLKHHLREYGEVGSGHRKMKGRKGKV